MSDVGNFPHELLTKIFARLNNIDRVTCLYVNRNWGYVVSAYFLYRNLRLANTGSLDMCLDMLDQKAKINRTDRQSSQLQNRDYGSFVKSVDLSYDGSTMVLSKHSLKRLASHCHNLEILKLRNSHDVRDDWVTQMLDVCPYVTQLNLSGCGFVTSRILEHPKYANIRLKLQSLNTIFCYQFLGPQSNITLPSLTDLRLQVMNQAGFEAVRKLVHSCAKSLKSLAILWRYRRDIESIPISTNIDDILGESTNLQKLWLDCQTGEKVEIRRFPRTLTELHLYCLCSSRTVEAMQDLASLKRIFVNYTFISQASLQMILQKNGNALEALGYNEGSGRPLTRSCLLPCVHLRSLQTHLGMNLELAKVLVELYRDTLEHLTNKWEGHTYLPSAFKPINGLWELLTQVPWVKIKSLDIVNAVVTRATLEKLPEAFPNVEYLGFIVSLEEDLSPDEWISYFSKFPYLKGIGLRQDLRLPFLVSDFWTGAFLRRYQSVYQDWSMNEQCLRNEVNPIRNPFDTWPQTMVLHDMASRRG